MSTKIGQIAARHITSFAEYRKDPDRWNAYAEEHLRKEVAFYIQDECSELHITENMAVKELRLYVATPEEFWKAVRVEAEKIATQFMCR